MANAAEAVSEIDPEYLAPLQRGGDLALFAGQVFIAKTWTQAAFAVLCFIRHFQESLDFEFFTNKVKQLVEMVYNTKIKGDVYEAVSSLTDDPHDRWEAQLVFSTR
jgi:hypothetical protein